MDTQREASIRAKHAEVQAQRAAGKPVDPSWITYARDVGVLLAALDEARIEARAASQGRPEGDRP